MRVDWASTGRARVRQYFSIDAMVRGIESVYDEVLAVKIRQRP